MASKFQSKVIKEYKEKGYLVLNIIKLSANGYPDLLCIKENETDIWIECKEKNDTLKELQKQRIDELISIGKRAICLQENKGIIYGKI
jgi:Holliday junction resolvase